MMSLRSTALAKNPEILSLAILLCWSWESGKCRKLEYLFDYFCIGMMYLKVK